MDVVDDLAQPGVTPRNAEVLLCLVPAFKLGPHVDLEVRPVLVVEEAAFVEPGLEVGVVQERQCCRNPIAPTFSLSLTTADKCRELAPNLKSNRSLHTTTLFVRRFFSTISSCTRIPSRVRSSWTRQGSNCRK
jgi:hypothetical protein